MTTMRRSGFKLMTGAVMLMFCSLPYSWSMFASPVEQAYGWPRDAVNLAFSAGIAGFCVGGIVGGVLQKRAGSRVALPWIWVVSLPGRRDYLQWNAQPDIVLFPGHCGADFRDPAYGFRLWGVRDRHAGRRAYRPV